MATNKLTAGDVNKTKKLGLHGDGGGLYLKVAPGVKKGKVTKSWVYRFMIDGTARSMGLGPYPLFSLADARQKALDAGKLRYEGIDPIDRRDAQRLAKKVDEAKAMTFKECAEAYIKAHRAGWKSPVHLHQWESSLKTYVYPVIGHLPVASVDDGLVMKVIEPHWLTKTETMSRTRGRIESVLDWATVRKYRTGENPARWKGHLDHLLPKKGKVKKRGHYAALPYVELPAFMARLRSQDGIFARALEFIILTGVRVSDLAGSDREDRTPMLWEHVSGDVWTIPETKNNSEHRVPLSKRAMEILSTLDRAEGVVFPGVDNDRIARTLKKLAPVTIHGFRSTFSTWSAEQTNFPSEVREQALAHTVGSDVARAYQRGDLFEKRRKLMQAWESFCRSTAICWGRHSVTRYILTSR